MKLQKTTLILVLIALGFAGVVYLVEGRGRSQQEAIQEKDQQLFTFEAEQVQAIEIERPEQRLIFERQSSGETDWRMKEPKAVPASDASIMFLLDKLVSSKSDRTLTVSPQQLEEYGLEKPIATIELTLDRGQAHTLILGSPDFSNSFLYARVDPLAKQTESKPTKLQPKRSNARRQARNEQAAGGETVEVKLVPFDLQYAVERPLSEWEQQAEEKSPEASPSPSASPSLENLEATPSPDLDPSETPSPEASPSPNSEVNITPSPEASPTLSPSPEADSQQPETENSTTP